MRTSFILFILILLSSCAKNPEEQAAEAIDIAQTLLSEMKCDEAIEVLEEVGRQNSNAIYLQVLASAYACKADFKETVFIANDIEDINSAAGQLMRSLSILTLSDETEADSEAYVGLLTGIDILLNADGENDPSQAHRNTVYGTRKAGDMGIQIVIMGIVEFGKFLNYYGNVSATGVKGGGSGTSSCFIDYTDPRAQAVITGGAGGACTVFNDGHADLSFAAANLEKAKRRLCEGLVLFTNIIDVLENIDLSGSSTYSSLEDVVTAVNTYKAAAVAAGLGPLLNITSQSECETDMDTVSNLNDMQYLYSLVFEAGLQ